MCFVPITPLTRFELSPPQDRKRVRTMQRQRKDAAAMRIQASYRGHQGRKEAEMRRREREAAAARAAEAQARYEEEVRVVIVVGVVVVMKEW